MTTSELDSKQIALSHLLDELHREYHRPRYLSSDPLEFVHRYHDPWDQEAVALISSLLAYGNVKQIRRSVSTVLEKITRLDGTPSQFIRGFRSAARRRKAYDEFEGWSHRFNTGDDVVLLLRLISRSWDLYGSLGSHFLSFFHESDQDIGNALSRLIAEWKRCAGESFGKRGKHFHYLLTSPRDGSCCKRWCMFLRWMGRKDALDPGLWVKGSPLIAGSSSRHREGLRASQLVMPLDTHTGRISQYLGLTQRKTVDWRAAVEVTQSLKRLDPLDPIRYDFALSRLGILQICSRKKNRLKAWKKYS